MKLCFQHSFAIVLICASGFLAQNAFGLSPLLSRGYTVIPEPQKTELSSADIHIRGNWSLSLSRIEESDPAIETLKNSMPGRLVPQSARNQGSIRLVIAPGSVSIGAALDKDKAALEAQAYSLVMSGDGITITANASAGLFYGAQTLAQLLKKDGDDFRLPEGRITDWPDLQLRQIYWDDAHHLDRIEYLKQALRTAASFKINGFALKLEGHFRYKSAPAIVEPWALTPEQYQELTNYGLRYHVQLIPYLDAPAHVAFVLKHPEYEKLRSWPSNNYEFCVTNPATDKLLFGMFDDLIAANQGVKYFYLSTDEAYYTGMPNTPQCNEKDTAQKLGGNGRLLAQFIQRAADYLHDRGRTVIFWGEFPLEKKDITSLPKHLVNGEVYGSEFDQIYRSHGIRQTIYTAVEGEEKLFPEYFPVPAGERLRPPRPGAGRGSPGRVAEAYNKIAHDSARETSDLLGAVVAAWGDMGLHTETFWLGYATATSASWNPRSDPRILMSAFYPLYFGQNVVQMDRAYQLLSHQARFWSESWETASSNARKPIVGNSYGIFPTPVPARDQHLPLPPLPAANDLSLASDWLAANKRLLELTAQYRSANDELIGLLTENLRKAERNQHGLEVFLTIANLCRENLDMIDSFSLIAGRFNAAQGSAANKKAEAAVAQLDRALDAVQQIRRDRNRVFRETTAVWAKSWHLRTPEANGRRFVHELDDVKDHLPDRTPDMSYLIYRELQLPVQSWFEQMLAVRNRYAGAHALPARSMQLRWTETTN